MLTERKISECLHCYCPHKFSSYSATNLDDQLFLQPQLLPHWNVSLASTRALQRTWPVSLTKTSNGETDVFGNSCKMPIIFAQFYEKSKRVDTFFS